MPVMLVCQYVPCGISFPVKSSLKDSQRFCSSKCMGLAKKQPEEIRDCAYCGEPFPLRKSTQERANREYCSRRCFWRAKAAEKVQKTLDRFWERMDRCDHERGLPCLYCCWPWKDTANQGGYGKLTYNGKDALAHRRAWEIHNERILPPEWEVLAWCKNRLCCNPLHLYAQSALTHRAARRPRVTLICPTCDKPFPCAPNRIKEGVVNYCSKPCRGQAQQVEYTPEEKLARQVAYQRKHRAQFTEEELRQKWLEEYYGNHDARLESSARYKANNLEDVRAKDRAAKKIWGAEHPDIIHAKNLRYYDENTEKVKAQTAAYQRNNPEKVQAFQERRRARKAGVANDLTADQWLEILVAFKHRCAYCNKKLSKLEQEHMTAVAHGGPNTLWNVVPACRKCNAEKHTGPVPVPVQPLLLTIAPAKPVKTRKKKDDL